MTNKSRARPFTPWEGGSRHPGKAIKQQSTNLRLSRPVPCLPPLTVSYFVVLGTTHKMPQCLSPSASKLFPRHFWPTINLTVDTNVTRASRENTMCWTVGPFLPTHSVQPPQPPVFAGDSISNQTSQLCIKGQGPCRLPANWFWGRFLSKGNCSAVTKPHPFKGTKNDNRECKKAKPLYTTTYSMPRSTSNIHKP